MQNNAYMPASTKPGMNPAMKSLPIDICVITPHTIISTDGGISMPKAELPAMQPSDTVLS